jgi:hypothetical protein
LRVRTLKKQRKINEKKREREEEKKIREQRKFNALMSFPKLYYFENHHSIKTDVILMIWI